MVNVPSTVMVEDSEIYGNSQTCFLDKVILL